MINFISQNLSDNDIDLLNIDTCLIFAPMLQQIFKFDIN